MSANRNTTTNPGERSAADIERDVEQTRARLTGTMEELKERVSPNQVAEQAMDWIRGSGGREFLGNLGASVRDNPMPVLLVAAGIGWLAMAGGRSQEPRGGYAAPPLRGGESWTGRAYGGESYTGESYPAESYAGQGLHDDGRSMTDRASEAAEGIRDSAGDMARRAGETASDLRDAAGNLIGRAGEALGAAGETGRRAVRRAGDALGAAGDTASDLGDRASRAGSQALHAASDMGSRAARYGSEAGSTFADTLQRQPLLLGAFGLAVGAALGALLPSSEAEDRLMGEHRDELAERAGSLAGEAYQDAKDKLAERGLTPERGAAALGEVARDLRETVERGVQDAKGVVSDAAERGADEDRRPGDQPDVRPIGGTQSGGVESGGMQSGGTPSGLPGAGPSTAGGPSATGVPGTRSGPQSGGPV